MQANLRPFIIVLVLSWTVACGSSEEAPKAKSPNNGDVLRAGEPADDSTTSTQKNAGSSTVVADEELEKDSTEDDKKKKKSSASTDDEDSEDDEEGTDEEDGKNAKFTSLKRDDDEFSLAVRVGKGSWKKHPWPAKGDSVEFSGVCSGSKVQIEVKIVHEDGKEFTKGANLTLNAEGKKVKVAFELSASDGDKDDKDDDKSHAPDDLLGELSCGSSKLSVK